MAILMVKNEVLDVIQAHNFAISSSTLSRYPLLAKETQECSLETAFFYTVDVLISSQLYN